MLPGALEPPPPKTELPYMFSYAETGSSVSFQKNIYIVILTRIINLLPTVRIGLRCSLKQNNQKSEDSIPGG